jgi:hypothetical protein
VTRWATHGENGIDLADEKCGTRHYAPIAVVLWIACALVSHPIVSGFLLLGAAATSGMFLFHGTTFAVSRLPDRWSNIAQVFVVAVFVAFLASYFLSSGLPSMETEAAFPTWSTLIILGIMGYVMWKGAELLDRRFWFRGFVIVAAAMFAFCWTGLNNVHFTSGDDEDYAYEAPAEPEGDRTPHFFVQFPLRTLASRSQRSALAL